MNIKLSCSCGIKIEVEGSEQECKRNYNTFMQDHRFCGKESIDAISPSPNLYQPYLADPIRYAEGPCDPIHPEPLGYTVTCAEDHKCK